MSKSDRIRSIASIFTMCASIVGVVSTAVLTAKSTPKAEEILKDLKKENPDATTLDVAKKMVPAYLPAIASGTVTIGCIIATTVLNKKNQISLASAYGILNHNYQRYRDSVKKLFGEDADQKVVDSIIKEECKEIELSSTTGWGTDTLDFDVDEEKRLFYDSYSERYFESTVGRVLQAEYHLNRNYIFGSGACLNEFYEFLGLEPIPTGDQLGWDFEGGLQWVDFNHRTVILEEDGNLECLVIDFVFDPWPAWWKTARPEDYMEKR